MLRLFLNALNNICALPCAGFSIGAICLALANHIEYHERQEHNADQLNQNIIKLGKLLSKPGDKA